MGTQYSKHPIGIKLYRNQDWNAMSKYSKKEIHVIALNHLIRHEAPLYMPDPLLTIILRYIVMSMNMMMIGICRFAGKDIAAKIMNK